MTEDIEDSDVQVLTNSQVQKILSVADQYLEIEDSELQIITESEKTGKDSKTVQDPEDASEVDTSDGSDSEYDKAEFNAVVIRKKRQRKDKTGRAINKRKNDLSVVVQPLPGGETVAAEAFNKLSDEQKALDAVKVNSRMKEVGIQTF